MKRYWKSWLALCAAGIISCTANWATASEDSQRPRQPLDPRGEIHVPIGIANAVDTLKTFVEAEGNFSPGYATYGIYFWVYDPAAKKLTAPTMDGVTCTRGLAEGGYLLPWSQWTAGQVTVKTEVCQVERTSPSGQAPSCGGSGPSDEHGSQTVTVSLYVALRPLGAAGGPVRELTVSDHGDALLVDGHPALVATEKPTAAGVLAERLDRRSWPSAARCPRSGRPDRTAATAPVRCVSI